MGVQGVRPARLIWLFLRASFPIVDRAGNMSDFRPDEEIDPSTGLLMDSND
jgi:hypothetical protein